MQTMKLLLLFVATSHAFRALLLYANAGNIPVSRMKAIMAQIYHDDVWMEHVENQVAVYQGTHALLNWTSSMQTDLVIDAIDNITDTSNNCAWIPIFEHDYGSVTYMFFFTDGAWCDGTNPEATILAFQGHKSIVVPIGVGSHITHMQLMNMAGPCSRPGCKAGINYMHINP